MFVAAISCKSKSQKDAENYMDKIEKTMKENPVKSDDQQKTKTGPFTIPQDIEDIVGEWEMVSFVGDTNDNLQIDEEERKNHKGSQSCARSQTRPERASSRTSPLRRSTGRMSGCPPPVRKPGSPATSMAARATREMAPTACSEPSAGCMHGRAIQ
jgi:hypothetical protein